MASILFTVLFLATTQAAHNDIRTQLDLGILLGEGGFVKSSGIAAQSFQMRAAQGDALVSITQSQAPPGATGLLNLSYNGLVTEQGTIAGFIVNADAPSDSQFIISAEALGLPDPTISLFEITQNGNLERASNDNCTEDFTDLVGRDFRNGVNACLAVELSTGLYFVEVSDVAGRSGNALISITQPSNTQPALLNLSYNGFVAAAGIRPGFIVASTQTYVLTAENLGLSDPAITLFEISSGSEQIVTSNDNCDQDLSTHIGRDIRNGENACLLTTLAPGLYFIEITGSDANIANCIDISGAWNGTESATVNCTIAGESFSDTQDGSGTIVINQNECNISYRVPGTNASRTGTITGNQLRLSGPFAEPLGLGVNFSQNEVNIEGIVEQNQMSLTGSGVASGTANGVPFSCDGNSEGTFNRLNTIGAKCVDVAGEYRGSYLSNYCDGLQYPGTFKATINPDNCAIEFITSEGTFGNGHVTGNTFQISTTDLECGAVTGNGMINSNSISGTYNYSEGGNGSFSGEKQ